jgi:hypothetical protein
VLGDPTYDQNRRVRDSPRQRTAPAPTSYPNDTDSETAQHNRLPSAAYSQNENYDPAGDMHFSGDSTYSGNYYRTVSGSAPPAVQQNDYGRFRPLYPTGVNTEEYENEGSPISSRREKHVLQKPHRQFPDGGPHGGKAKRVMDFFRMRGKVRAEA